jgi:hypothetical protein
MSELKSNISPQPDNHYRNERGMRVNIINSLNRFSLHTVWKNRNMNKAKQVSNFLIYGANNVVEHLEKELKFCTNVLLRADLINQGRMAVIC